MPRVLAVPATFSAAHSPGANEIHTASPSIASTSI